MSVRFQTQQGAIDPARINAARHKVSGGDFVSALIKEGMMLIFPQRQIYGFL
jgi:hypothetical protein